jgi:8-oxo-dGTP diphosphatase
MRSAGPSAWPPLRPLGSNSRDHRLPDRIPVRLPDAVWRLAFRLGFPLARTWWRLRRPSHQGALVAVYVGRALLLVRSSYRAEWNLPGGAVKPGETPEAAARRELAEEIGLAGGPLLPAGEVCGVWGGRRGRVHFFDLHLDRLPELRLDRREIIAARLVAPSALRDFALTGPVAAYLDRDRPGCAAT